MRTVPTRTVQLAGGRTLALHDEGDPAGAPVLVHHGTPSAGLLYNAWVENARARGIRLIGIDRAGYGGSTRAAGRTVGDVAADVHAIADELELGRFATWGISGGGPHALASAALCDERLVAAASLAAVAPWDAEGLDWLAGMGQANLEEFEQVLRGEDVLRPALETQRVGLLAATPEDLLTVFDTLLGNADRAVLTAAFAEWACESTSAGLAVTVDGWVDDDLAFVRPWGFEVTDIARPVLVVHGADDLFVPVAHGRWLAERIPGATAWIDDTHGHLTLIERRVAEVHDWLLTHF